MNKVLITIPHAGGSSELYKGWDRYLNGVDVINYDYPGHWLRTKEPLAASIHDCAKEVAELIRKNIYEKNAVSVFGHSMGAIVGWEAMDIISKEKLVIDNLIVSASESPRSFPGHAILGIKSDKDALAMCGYDTKGHSLAENKLFQNIFLPIIKHDLELCANYKVKINENNRDTKVHLLVGKDDKNVTLEEMASWNQIVKVKNQMVLNGNHFYLKNRENKIIVCNYIKKVMGDE